MKKIWNNFLARWGMMFAFLMLAGAGMYAINSQADSNAETLYQTQIAGCKRGNLLRIESNQRIVSHTLDRDVLSEFLSSAAAARQASGTKNDLKTAAKYRRLRDSLRRVTFGTTPLVDCNKTIQKP